MGAVLSLHFVPCCCLDRSENGSEQQGLPPLIQSLVEERIQAEVEQRVQAKVELLASQFAARLAAFEAKHGGEHEASASQGGYCKSAVLAGIPQEESAAEVLRLRDVQDIEEATTTIPTVFQGVKELSLAPHVIVQDLETKVEESVSQTEGPGAELLEASQRATTSVDATFNEADEPLLPLPVYVPELDQSMPPTVSAEHIAMGSHSPELAAASEENIAMGNHWVEEAAQKGPALRLTGTGVELGKLEDDVVRVQQVEAMLESSMHDSAELAKQTPDGVAAISQLVEEVEELAPPPSGSDAIVDEDTKQDTTMIAQQVEGTEGLFRPQGEWEELCACDGLSDGEDTMAFAGFAAESGRRLAHDALLLVLQDALDMCDNPDFKQVFASLNPHEKFIAIFRVAATGWSGMHALLFYMWTFSDHFATKQLLVDIDVAFASPPGTFMKKTEVICRYWYKLLHMPPQQKNADECARQMKNAFHEIESLLLAYHQNHQQYAGASVTSDTGVAAQEELNEAFVRRLIVHYAIWGIVPDICKVVVNADHQQMMADSRTGKISSYVEIFHALQLVCGSRSYMHFAQSILASFKDSEVVLQTSSKLLAKCGLPKDSFPTMCDSYLSKFYFQILSKQPVFPGGEGMSERVFLMLKMIEDDEGLTTAQKYLERQQSHFRLLYNDLVARAREADPGTLKEQVEKTVWVSASKRPRMSVGGA